MNHELDITSPDVSVLRIFKFNGKQLRIFGTDEKPMFLAKEIGEILEITNIRENLRTLNEDEKIKVEIFDASSRRQKMTVIGIDSLKKLITRTRKTVPQEFLELLRPYGLKMNIIVPRKETVHLNTIQLAFSHIPSKREVKIHHYRVDLFFPSLNLIVECDEFDHKNYDIDKEIQRELFLKGKGFQIIRFNPDEKYFNIGKVINDIILKLLNIHT